MSRKFKCRNLGCPYESVSFNKIRSHTWDKHSLAQNLSFKYEISSCTKRCTNLQNFRRSVKSKHYWFFDQHIKYFNTQQEAAEDADLLVNNPDIHKVDDLQQNDFSEVPREDLQEGTDGLYTDESSVNQFDLMTNLLLELRGRSNLRINQQLAL